MTAARAQRIEQLVDGSASAVLSAAVAWCGLRLKLPVNGVLATATLVLVGSILLLRAVSAGPRRYRVADFLLVDVPAPAEELLLTEAERLPQESDDRPAELLLDDVLAELGPDSRVVRLFDPATMPTPGELRARIDRHLGNASAPDASQALHEALAELRRSIR